MGGGVVGRPDLEPLIYGDGDTLHCKRAPHIWRWGHFTLPKSPSYMAMGTLCTAKKPLIFLCLPRAERNQRFLFVKNESIKFCCSGGFSNVPDVMEASVLFISTVFHVRSVSCRCLYLGFRAPCAARVTRVTCSKRSLLGVPLELE